MTKSDYAVELFMDPQPCPACNGTGAEMLGTLGNTAWMRCRNCGIDYRMEDQE